MTYFEVLLIFIIPPIIGLALLTYRDWRRGIPLVQTGFIPAYGLLAIGVHVLIALVYTTPWDNYLVASDVWWYEDDRIIGLHLGYVPIEEYGFFILQPLLVGFFLLTLSRYGITERGTFRPNPKLRLYVTAGIGLLWVIFAGLLLSGWDGGRYLALIMVWALFPVGIQLAFGADILLARWKFVLAAILIPSLYLNIVDLIAIDSGAWIISPDQTTGILIAGILPIEEATFFTITTILIAGGMSLLMAEESQPRIRAIWDWLKARLYSERSASIG